MSHCQRHNTNNCVECALERQTKELVKVLRETHQPAEKPMSLGGLIYDHALDLFVAGAIIGIVITVAIAS